MSVPGAARYERQRRLAEVGAGGQERLRAADVRAHPGEGAGRGVEALYLERAGVGWVTVADDATPPPFRHAASFEFVESAEFAAAAHRALATIREILGLGTP